MLEKVGLAKHATTCANPRAYAYISYLETGDQRVKGPGIYDRLRQIRRVLGHRPQHESRRLFVKPAPNNAHRLTEEKRSKVFRDATTGV